MSRAALIASLAVLTLALPVHAAERADLTAVRDTSIVDQTGARRLRGEVDIKAPPAAVWRALTDQDTYRRWVVPSSFIDLRVGGSVEVAFSPQGRPGDPGNLKQEITAYLPERLLVFRNVQNPRSPGGAAYGRLAIVMDLTPLPSGGTRVALSQVGYGTGADFDAMYVFFKTHNPEYLADLKRFVESTS